MKIATKFLVVWLGQNVNYFFGVLYSELLVRNHNTRLFLEILWQNSAILSHNHVNMTQFGPACHLQ